MSVGLVIDVSFVGPFVLPGEDSGLAGLVFDQGAEVGIVVPDLFWHEATDVLLMAERRGRCDRVETESALADLKALPFKVRSGPAPSVVLSVARMHELTAYDAA